MSTDHERTPHKLVYLRDHAPRPRARSVRVERKAPVASSDLAGEAAWLGRFLLAASGLIVIHWLLVLSGAFEVEGDVSTSWTASRLLPHAYVAGTCAFAARQLLRGNARAALMIAFAASGLMVVAVEGLAHLVINSDLSRMSLAARTDILTRSGMLGLGIWSASYALRADRRTGAA
ncbi:hypothetical protein K2Z84_20565 [Candidatus Binatia bacterium]|nr:hypothetical protein [Candidatus Binatia bacterium]